MARMTDVTAEGLIAPRDWTKDHDLTHGLYCTAWVKIVNGQFVPAFTQPGKPFQCIAQQPRTLPSTATYK